MSSTSTGAEAPRQSRIRAQPGLTYVEVILMVAVLATGFAAVEWLAQGIVSQNADAREVGAATLIAHEQMERLKLQGYSALQDTGGIEGSAGPYDAGGDPSPTGAYLVRWDVQDNVPVQGVKRLRVEVAWTDPNSHQRQLALDTVVTNVAP